MSKTSREKIALLIFFCLILIGLGGTIAYLNVGHSWNVAASNIDDATGDMAGYTAILYEGTEPNLIDGDKKNEKASNGSAATTTSPATSTAPSAASEGAPGPGASSAEGDEVPLFNSNAANNKKEEKKMPVVMGDVEKSYQDKKAAVFVLDVVNPSLYAEGMILRQGNHRFGVFSVPFNQSIALIEKQVEYFKEYKVDFIVAITPAKKFVEKVPGIDIAISLKDEGLFLMGETIKGTFYVDAPFVGQVGAILISPHSVVSAKDIEEL
ncbi:MAG: alcohol dehydrogenase [Raoultibacter sp.]